ncbi:MAG: TonB-dependent siderophore receptor, partial [Cyanobacteria bacterium P01_H01_bin.58]
RITGEADDDASNETLRIGYDFEHRFSDNWRIRTTFSYYRFDPIFVVAGAADPTFLGLPPAAPGELLRAYTATRQLTQDTALQTNVVGEFATGSIEHTLLAGVDLSWSRLDQSGLQSTTIQAPVFGLPYFNIFDPVYGVISRPANFSGPLTATNDSYREGYGIYVQDQIQLADNLHLLAGLRYDIIASEGRTGLDTGNINKTSSRSTAFSPRLGVVYQPIEPLSLYASYSRSFVPNNFAVTATGELLEPERGVQFEVGARAELFEGRLVANLAVFDITKQNVATDDPNFLPGSGFSVAIGEQRSRGIELDVIGEILPGWNVVANYAYTDATITESNDNINPEGNRLFGVPEHNINLWTTYEIQEGDLAGLGFGLGVNYVGERFGDNLNSFVLEDYFLTNAAIFYERNDWNFALNIRNLFDVNFIDSSENSRDFEIRPGEGFTIIGSVSVEF